MKIKQGLEEKYKNFITINDNEAEKEGGMGKDYAQGIINTAERIGVALDEGKTPEEAEKTTNGHGLTGNMVGIAMGIVTHFNPRGDEMRVWWNKYCGGTGEEKGTINPAILHFETKE